MPRRSTEFQTIRSEGGLLPPDLLRRLVDPTGKVSGVEPSAYGLPEGERLTEAITQSWTRLRRHWADFRAAAPKPSASDASPLATRHSPPTESEAFTGTTNDKWSLPLLRELGFGFLATSAAPTIDGKTYAISRFAGNTAIHLVGCGVSLDRRAAGVRGAAQSNPHGLVQEFLNRSAAHLWAIVSNGLSFRILRDNQALSRQSFLEFDLEGMFDGEVYSDFVLLWLIAHATRFLPRNGGGSESCWLETWSKEAADQGVAALTDLRGGVEQALQILGQGFVSHPKNTALREALRKGDVKLSDFHGQLLRIVYRLIFLFVAEDRELEGIPLLHPQDKSDAARLARDRYAAHYSTTRLRELASRIKGSRHGDLWRQFQLIVGALSGDDRFATMRATLGLPSLGSMLWNPASTAILNGPGLNASQLSTLNPQPGDATELSNVDFLEALRHLAFIRKDKILRPVDYKNLGSPEFGGVYESFLALTPQISGDGARFTFAEFAGNERKTSGSYYTPDSLVQCLLDSALDPVVQERLADAERLAKSDWAAVEKEIQSDPVKRNYVLAFLTKRAGAARGATGDALKRAWDSIPPALRRWQLSEEAILAIKVCDKACGSGHFLVGAGHRLARHLARVRALAQGESEPSPLLYQTALRDVIGHCLYGVDINPMAVELCKVTLWLEALEPGKPLSFLDHHIRCGNSLLGATPELIRGGIPEEAYAAIEGDDKEACSALKKQNKRENPKLGEWFIADEAAIRDKLFQAAAAIDEMSDSRPEDIRRKEAAFRAEQSNYDFQKAWDLANLWCAAFVIKKHFPESAVPLAIDDRQSAITETPGEAAKPLPAWFGVADQDKKLKAKGRKPSTLNYPPTTPPIGITTQHLRDFVEGGALPDGLLAEARRLADQYQFFHFHLAFPEVFAQGGFDVSLGNPPWERVALQEKEWFAERQPDIAAAANAAGRKKDIASLKVENPELWAEWQNALRQADGEVSLLRNSGRFPLCGRGDVNTYSIFTELNRTLIAENGRVGIIVPTGIATDATTQLFFKELIESRSLLCLYGFENEGKLFEGVDHRVNFCVLVFGRAPVSAVAEFSAFLRHPDVLRGSDRRYKLSATDIALLNPNTHTCPVFRSTGDAEITKAIYRRVPVLSKDNEPKGDPWRVSFRSMFHMSGDSELFHTRETLETDGWKLAGNVFVRDDALMLPLYEAKMTYHFNHRFGDFALVEPGERAHILPTPGYELLSRPDYVPMPRYWVDTKEVAIRIDDWWHGDWFVGWRDVTDPRSSVRTVVSCIIPRTAVSGKFPILLTKENPTWFVYAILTSYVFDYVARQKLGGVSLSMFVMRQLPVLPPPVALGRGAWTGGTQVLKDWLLPRVLELTYTAWDLEAFAQDCGWSGPPFRWEEERRFLLRCELDAAFFHLYLGPEPEWSQQPDALTQAFPTPRHAVSYILDTFPIVKRKDEARTEEKNAAGEVVRPGRYITKETILEIYDALTESMQTGKAYQTRLDPPPADARCCHPPKQAVISAPTWMDRPLVLPTGRRVILTPDRYRATVVPHLLYQAGGRISFDRFRKAYWLLTEPKTLERFASNTVGEIARRWSRTFGETLQKDMFIPHLKGAVGRQLHFVRKDGERWLELRDPKVADDEHVIFDARLAILVADIWPLTEPITPLAPAEEITIQELEAVL